jgi:hypothetical protein
VGGGGGSTASAWIDCTAQGHKGSLGQFSEQVLPLSQVHYNGQNIEAAWPLGAALNDML